jgi:tetratricopeptide (TPR) repeat protein
MLRKEIIAGSIFSGLLLLFLRGPAGAESFLRNVVLIRLNAILLEEAAAEQSSEWEFWLQDEIIGQPVDARIKRVQGLVLMKQGHTAAAINTWQSIDDVGAELITWGSLAQLQGNYPEALTWYELAEAVAPQLLSNIAYGRYITYQSLAEPETAYISLEQAVTSDVNWLRPEWEFQAWYDWGTWLYEQDQLVAAEIAIQQAISKYSDATGQTEKLSEAYRFLGLAQWNMDKLPQAVTSLQKATELNPENIWAHIHFGKVLYLSEPTRMAETETAFAKALELNGQDTAVWQNIIEFWQWVGAGANVKELCEQASSKAITTIEACLRP